MLSKVDREIFVFMMDVNLMPQICNFNYKNVPKVSKKCQQSGPQPQLLFPN